MDPSRSLRISRQLHRCQFKKKPYPPVGWVERILPKRLKVTQDSTLSINGMSNKKPRETQHFAVSGHPRGSSWVSLRSWMYYDDRLNLRVLAHRHILPQHRPTQPTVLHKHSSSLQDLPKFCSVDYSNLGAVHHSLCLTQFKF